MTPPAGLPRCGCGGEAECFSFRNFVDRRYQFRCKFCRLSTSSYDSKAKAAAAWTRAMSRAAGVEEMQLLREACASVENQANWDKSPYSGWYYRAKALAQGAEPQEGKDG